MHEATREYLRMIGRRGGKKRTAKKTAAARINIRKRWSRETAVAGS